MKNTQFFKELDEDFVELVPKAVVLAQKKVAFDIFAGVIEASPVMTGRYRASHTLQADTPDETVAPEPEHFKSGKRKGMQKAYPNPKAPKLNLHVPQTANEKPRFTVVWINNSLPYSEVLEDGSSKQAPSGVYGPVLAALGAEVLTKLGSLEVNP